MKNNVNDREFNKFIEVDGKTAIRINVVAGVVLDTIAAGYAVEGEALGSGVLIQGDDGTDRTNVLVDAAGHLQVDVLSGGGAGTQYTEDAVAEANPEAAAQILIRQDTPAGLTSADGDNVARRGTNYGAAFTQILDSSGSFVDTFGGGTQYTEGDTDASITGTALMWEDAADTLRAVSSAKPLPVSITGGGDATAANQTTVIGHVDGIETLLTGIDSDTNIIQGAVAAGQMQVDVVAALPAGSNNIGDVDIASSVALDVSAATVTVDLGVNNDVTVTSGDITADTELTTGDLDVGAGTDTKAIIGLVGSKDGGGEIIPGSATDGLLVNLGANNDVTVTGTVTANAGTNLNTSALATSAKQLADGHNVTVDNGASAAAVNIQDGGNSITVDGTFYQATQPVSGTFWQATQPVSLASVPSHEVTNAGTFTVQEDGAALTALQLLDDVVFVDDTATHATGATKGVGIMAAATPTDSVADANDIGMVAMSLDRRLLVDAQIVGTDAALDVSAATVTVDGTITANLSATDNAVLDQIELNTDPLLVVGGGAEDTAQRVTIASDSTGVISIDDNAGSLTVDSGAAFTVQEDGAALTALQLIDNPIATISTTPLQRVAIFDDSDTQITSFGGGTQYDEDTAHVSGDKVTMAGVVQKTADAALAADGDRAVLQVDDTGYLKVNIKAGSSSGTEYTEDVATANPQVGSAIMMERDDQVAAVTPIEGDWIGLRGTSKGLLWVALADASGDPITSFGGGQEYVTNAVAPDPATGKAGLMERDDALSVLTPIEGDWVRQRSTAEGALWTQDFNSDALLSDTNAMVVDLAAIEVLLGTIDADTSTLAGAVAAGQMQVDIVADGAGLALAANQLTDGHNVTVDNAAGAAAVNIQDGGNTITVDGTLTSAGNVTNAGTFVVQEDGAALTALQLIDDIIFTDDTSTHTTGTTKGAGIMAAATPTDGSVAANDIGMLAMSLDRRLHVDAQIVGTDADLKVTLDSEEVVLGTGANAIGKLAANTGVDIGDVDILSIAAGTNVIGKVRLVDSGGTEITETTDHSMNVTIVADDVGIGGGTQYTEDAAVPANPVGTAIVAERDDALGGITPIAGDWTHLFTDANGALWTHDDALDAALSGSELQVDIVAELPAGTQNIGDVDIASSVALDVSAATVTVDGTVTANLSATDNAVLDQIELNTDPLLVVGGGTEAAAQRVTIASDSTGLVSIDDGGGSITVDGSLTVDLGANNDVTVTSISAGDNNIGNVDIVSGTITTVTTLTGGGVAHDGADSGNPHKMGGRAQDIIGAEPEEVADNDRVDALFDQNGRIGVTAGSDYKYADINDAVSGDNTIIAAQAAGKRIAVWAILIVSDGTVDVRWEDGAGGTAFTGQIPLQVREGYSISAGGLVPLFVGSAATLLNLELSAAINVHGFVSYTVIED